MPHCQVSAAIISLLLATRYSLLATCVDGHPHRYDPVRIAHRLAALELVDVGHAVDDLAPDGVLAVEECRVGEADEELAVGRIRALSAGHRAGAANVRLAIELGLELFAGA